MQPDTDTTRHWAPPIGLVVIGWIATAAAIGWWLVASTATDRVFVGLLVIGLAAVSAHGSALRPRLTADLTGITVRTMRGTRRWAWSEVRVRIQQTERFGRRIDVLEIDYPRENGSTGLMVLGRLELGDAPLDVAAELARLSR